MLVHELRGRAEGTTTTLAPGSESAATEAGTLAGTADLGAVMAGEIADTIGAVD